MDFRPTSAWTTCAFLLLLSFSVLYFWDSHAITRRSFLKFAPSHKSNRSGANVVSTDLSVPLILFWTDFFSKRFDTLDALDTLRHCPEVSCQISSNRAALSRSSAVLFHPRDMLYSMDIPAFRHSHQYYVFYLLESPFHTGPDLNVFGAGFFNLTFTYRLDSDIPSDYYHKNYKPKPWNSLNDFENSWARKTKFAATFESYCMAPSMRRVIVDQLSQKLPVGIYGACGTLKCEKYEQLRCDELLGTYKFFLAFENSVCQDYVTEKIHRALNLGVVPVVLGGMNYSAISPPSSFIDVLDFPSIDHLARHLSHVASDKQLYASYFKWKILPAWKTLSAGLASANSSWCSLCRLLHQKPKPFRWVASVKAWWEKPGVCSAPLRMLSGAQAPTKMRTADSKSQ